MTALLCLPLASQKRYDVKPIFQYFDPAHEILAHIAYGQKSSINANFDISSWTKDLNVSLSLHLRLYA